MYTQQHVTCNSVLHLVQEEILRKKQEAKKKQQQKSSTKNADTADSSHAVAAAAGTDAKSVPNASTDKGKATAEDATSVGSPFACVSAILGWETFHMVHVLWIGLIDLPGKAPEKDWGMQVGVPKPS